MINSVRRFGWQHDLWVLCLNAECETALSKLALPDIRLLSLETLEDHIPELRDAKKNRDHLDYYFTCMAALHSYLHDTISDIDCTMYVDADMQFFDTPDIVFSAIGDAPLAIIPHNFPAAQRDRERFGIYNAGWTAFRRTEEGRACQDAIVPRWNGDIEPLHALYAARLRPAIAEAVRGGARAMRDFLPQIAPDSKIRAHKGFNCAPCNIANSNLQERNGRIFVDDVPLVFFHFHYVKKLLRYFYFDCHRSYGTLLTRFQRNKLYRPYIRELVAMEILATRILPAADTEKRDSLPLLSASAPRLSLINQLRRQLPQRRQLIDLLSGRALLAIGKSVW
jgi:hypothetical protein